MSLPKCRFCGKTITDKKAAYKVVRSSRNYYYCNQEEYRLATQPSEQEKILGDIEFLIDCNLEIKYNSNWNVIRKGIKQFSDIYSGKQVYQFLDSKIDYICSALNKKSFDSEYKKIQYFFAIVRNHIQEYVDKHPVEEAPSVKEVDFYMAPANYKPTNQRLAMKDIEESCDE